MNTVSSNKREYAFWTSLVLGIVALVFAFNASFPTASAAGVYTISQAHGIVRPAQWFAGSDCIANRASGDFYPRGQNSSHCEVGNDALTIETPVKGIIERVVNTIVATLTSVPEITEATPVVITTTPSPVVVTSTPSPVVTSTPVVIVTNTPAPVVTDTDECAHANPGNHKCVGNAGEDPNGNGTMSLDSTDGNGEHGNQGQGGKDK